MIYRVRLINSSHNNCPYELGGIMADNEDMAIKEAKSKVVYDGYWFSWESNIKERYDKLQVESIEIDN